MGAFTKRRPPPVCVAVARIEVYLPQVEVMSEGDHISGALRCTAGAGRAPATPAALGLAAELHILVSGQVVSYRASSRANSEVREPHRQAEAHPSAQRVPRAAVPQDVRLDGNRSIWGGQTNLLQPGDSFGAIPFFTGGEQLEVRVEGPRGWPCSGACCSQHKGSPARAPGLQLPPHCAWPPQTVLTQSVVHVLAIQRTDYQGVAERFKDSARAVLRNLQRMAEDVRVAAERRRTRVAARCAPSAARAHLPSCCLTPPPPTQLALEEFPSGLPGARQFDAAVGAINAYRGDVLASMLPDGAAPQWAAATPADSRTALTSRQRDAVTNVLRVRALVEAYVQQHDEDRLMAFLSAASRGDVTKVRLMLEEGFDPNSADYGGRAHRSSGGRRAGAHSLRALWALLIVLANVPLPATQTGAPG